MNQETLSTQSSSKSRKWLFVAAGSALIVLCVCLAATAAIVLPSLANIGQSTVSYTGLADEQLKNDTLQLLAQYEQGQTGCGNVTLFAGNVMLHPAQTEDGSWVEMWQVNACGASRLYNITFTPDGIGGTYISASPID